MDRRSPARLVLAPVLARVLALVLAPAVGLLVLLGPASAADSAAPRDEPVGTWPLHPEPPVVGEFDPPDTPFGAGHRGVDLLGRAGQAVRAALPGRVSFAGSLAGRGVVVVDHGGTRTTYEPVSASVPVGTPVTAGALIGTLEPAGSHCSPRTCLHSGWIEDPDTYLDPLSLVGAGPVRLLPLWRDEPIDAGHRLPATGARVAPAYAAWQPLLRLAALLS